MCQMLNALIEMKSGQLNKELPRKWRVENCLKGKLQKKKKKLTVLSYQGMNLWTF